MEASKISISSPNEEQNRDTKFWLSSDKVELTFAINIFGEVEEFCEIEKASSKNGKR
jgi:hypothetical protein